MTVCDTISDSVSEVVESPELAELFRQMPLEPRCRVCRNDTVRAKVNGLLAVGTSYAMILRSVADENGKIDRRERMTIDSIRNHTAGTSPCRTSPGPRTGPSLSAGRRRTASTSSMESPRRSHRWPSSKPSWPKAMKTLSIRTPRSM